MKRRAGYCLIGAILALGITGLTAPSQAQRIVDPTDNYDTGVNLFELKVNSDLQYLPGPRGLLTLEALRSIGFSDQNIADVLPLLIDYRDALTLRTMDEAQLTQDMMSNTSGNFSGTQRSTEINQRFRDRVDKIWQTATDRVGADKVARLRELVGDAIIERTVTTTAYTDEHLNNIDRLMADWDRLSTERTARQNTVIQEQTTVVQAQPAPAPAPQVEAPAPAPQQSVETNTRTEQRTSVTTQSSPRPRAHRRSRMHRRVRGLG